MKTLKIAFVALLAMGLSLGVNAQDSKTQTAPAKTNAQGQHLKKDGTPDMRYKENKQAAASSKGTAAKSESSATAADKSKSTSAKSSAKASSSASKGKSTKKTPAAPASK
jgi:hypothetical protein